VNARDRVPDKTLPEWVEFYRRLGLQPLPSSRRDKRPLIPYGHAWESELAVDWKRFPDCNLQIMTGRHWDLLVVDLDGPKAREWIESFPWTWTVQSGSGTGYHLWYRPDSADRPLPKCFLHKGTEKHDAIERMCDRSVIVVPPSIHPRTGQPYRWVKGRHPFTGRERAIAPKWVMDYVAPTPEPKPVPTPIANHNGYSNAHGKTTRRFRYPVGLLDQITDKTALAQSWGLRIASSQPNAAGWLKCHVIGREDRTPSASFRPESGHYSEPGAGLSLNLYQLGAALGAYPDREACMKDLAIRYGLCRPSRVCRGRQK
jgi:hypothetical protein